MRPENEALKTKRCVINLIFQILTSDFKIGYKFKYLQLLCTYSFYEDRQNENCVSRENSLRRMGHCVRHYTAYGTLRKTLYGVWDTAEDTIRRMKYI